MKKLLYVALAVGAINGFLWRDLPQGSYYVLNSLFVFILCLYIWLNDKNSFIKFALAVLSLNELFDEMLFDNSVVSTNEIVLALALPLFWAFKKRKHETNINKRGDSSFNN